MSRPALRVCRKPTMSSFPRSSTPHHTIASAQVLPDLPYFGVVGTLGAGDEIDLYQLALDSIPERLDFGLVMQGRGGSVPATFQILDGSGQVLGTWNLGSVGNSSIQVDLERLSPGSTLYLGVSAGNSSTPGGTFGTVDYQLWVAHQPALPPDRPHRSATRLSPSWPYPCFLRC